MRVSAKADYAVRAAAELAAPPARAPSRGRSLAEAQDIPLQFLEHILLELKHPRDHPGPARRQGGLLARPSRPRGDDRRSGAGRGGARSPTSSRLRPRRSKYSGNSESLRDVWVAVRASLRSVLEEVTLADLVRPRTAAGGRESSLRSPMPGTPAPRPRKWSKAAGRYDRPSASSETAGTRSNSVPSAARCSAVPSRR